MKNILPLIVLTMLLAACSNSNQRADSGPKGISVMDLKIGVGYDKKDIIIGQGDLKDKVAVIVYFGVS